MSKSLRKVLACKVDDDLDRAVRHAALRDGVSLSAFLRQLARQAVVGSGEPCRSMRSDGSGH